MKKSELVELVELINSIVEKKKNDDLKKSVRDDIASATEKFIYDLSKLITTSKLPYEMIQGLMFSKMFYYSKQYYDGDFNEKQND